ncbi:hypothetical protein [Aurantiacibacter spongiae]|uniref:Uncharacterized protein n=1 Tax=Aurantiacibacter spongiae TaxID=2488860 RepID=A0A3N5DAR5_9SPHN|nr:hypothetical protein [Aurantiacibacter spongiae]RPF71798.1 hypothetical protein EG799_09335 [Aurantiacibacter spongiae]
MARTDNRPAIWAATALAAIATVSGLKLSGAIDSTSGFILLALAFVPAGLFVRAMDKAKRSANLAVLRYNRRMMIAGLGYVLGLGAAISIFDRYNVGEAATMVLALLPVVPILAMIWAMARYLIEERDEYLRYRSAVSSLVGLALLLGVACFWGFLETFELVPHAPGWYAFPLWAIGMGLAQGWQALANRAGADE